MKIFTRKKILTFTAEMLILSVSSSAYSAALNTPAYYGQGTNTTQSPSMSQSQGQNQNSQYQYQNQGGYYQPAYYGYGYEYEYTNSSNNNQQNQNNQRQQNNYDYNQNFNVPYEPPVTDVEINHYFDQILNSRNDIDPDPSDPRYDPEAIDERERQSEQEQQYIRQQYFGNQDMAAGTTDKSKSLTTDILEMKSLKERMDYYDQQKKIFRSAANQLFYRIPRYGMSFFRLAPSTYAPMNDAVPVAQDYRISVGDEMTVSIWGIPEEGNFMFQVNRDGMVSLPRIGSVRLAGYTFAEADRILRARFNQYYAGYQMNLSMGRLSSIMVYVTGNAVRPGAYTISSFSTLVNALIASGGPSLNGSLRKIELRRQGQLIAIFDMYAMLMRGDKSQDLRLQAGDVIHIPNVGPLIGIAGEIRQPGVYELNGATRVQDLLSIVGGLNARTFTGRIQFYTVNSGAYMSVFEGSLSKIENRELHDGDILRLYPVYNFASTVSITGPLMRPGKYAVMPGSTKIADIINNAGGLSPTASDRAEVLRVTPTLQGPVNEYFEINIAQALMGDPENNITLENNDQITVFVIPEWKQQMRVTITGEVKRPGSYAMFPGERLSDLITKAGGFTHNAFLRGAIFTRKSVAKEQKKALNQMADQMERDLLQSMQTTGNASAGETNAINAEIQRRKALIDSLRELDVMGRVVTKIDTPKNIIGTEWDYELVDGDALRIPATPLTVNVMGAVYSSTTHTYNSKMSINAYVNAAGGALKNAHKRLVYLLKSDGSVIRLTRTTALLASKEWKGPRGYIEKVEPGDTIVVPVKNLDRTNIESFKDTVDIIYKVAVAAGVILDQINDN